MIIDEALVLMLTQAAGVDPSDTARLEACHRVAALTQGRVYPKRAPQKAKLPHIVYHRISGPREHSHDGASGLAHPRFQLDLWARTAAAVRELAEAVRVALDGFRGSIGDGAEAVEINGIFLEDDDDDWDDDRNVYMYRQDYTVWHNE